MAEILGGEGAGPRGAAKGAAQAPKAPGAQAQLGQVRQLEIGNIPALQRLPRMGPRISPQGSGMRRVQDRGPRDPLGVAAREVPGDHAAPIMPDHGEPPVPERIGHAEHVIRKRVEPVGGDAGGLVREVVAALVGRDYP